MKGKLSLLLAAAGSLLIPSLSQGVVITFDGGTAYFVGGGSVVTDNNSSWSNVDYYEEDGFRLDFIGNSQNAFSAHIGDYYGAGNAVIHGHWATGDFGELTSILVTKIDNSAFDLNYFILTSNTDTGGSPASGNEQAFIKNNNGNDIELTPEDWGFPATSIFLPSSYDGITSFEFYVKNAVDCFGMDEFFIDEPPPIDPPNVPEGGSTLILLSAAMTLVAGAARLQRKKATA